MPGKPIAAVVIVRGGREILTVWNSRWKMWTLPVTKLRTDARGDATEHWNAAARRALLEGLGTADPALTRWSEELDVKMPSGATGELTPYRTQIWRVRVGPGQDPVGEAQDYPWRWRTIGEVLAGGGRLSPTAVNVLQALGQAAQGVAALLAGDAGWA